MQQQIPKMKHTPLGTSGVVTHTTSGANIPTQNLISMQVAHNQSQQQLKPNQQTTQALNFRQNLNMSLQQLQN